MRTMDQAVNTKGRERDTASLLLPIVALWGLTYVLVGDVVKVLPPAAFLAWRFVPAALILGYVARKRLRHLSLDGWISGITMGGWLTAAFVLQTVGLQHTSAANAGFITGLSVVIVPLVVMLLRRRVAAVPVWFSAVISAAGLYLLAGTTSGSQQLGDLLMLGCAAAFAGQIVVSDKAVQKHDAGALAAVQVGTCAVMTTVWAASSGQLSSLPTGSNVWFAIAVCAVLATAAGFFVQASAQRRYSPEKTALILASEAGFAALFSYLFGGETFTVQQMFGGGLICLAVVVPDLTTVFKGLVWRPGEALFAEISNELLFDSRVIR